MYKIYLLKDINGLCYIGKTNQILKQRCRRHRYARNRNNYCSSQKLDLDNCEIILLEECDESIASEREQYWINNTDCVNDRNAIFDKEHKKEYEKQRYKYQNSWGGKPDNNNNSLLKIDIDLFSI